MMVYRHEDKYLLDPVQSLMLRLRAEGLMFPDPHVGEDGTYTISSLYFDDLDDTCYYENEDGIGERDKYRIRIYDDNLGFIKLERKSKKRNLCHKKSEIISFEQCRSLMKGELPALEEGQGGAGALFHEMRHLGMIPKVIVSYKRIPYIYPAGNVRLTFDYDIGSSMQTEAFGDEGARLRPVLAEGACIMEVKWDELLPRHLMEVLQIEGLRRSRFSKYYICRNRTII